MANKPGNALPCRRREIKTEADGFRAWKLTDWDDSTCTLPYPTMKPFSPDGRYLIIGSDRSGNSEIYRLDLEKEEAVPITGPGGVLQPDGLPEGWEWKNANMHRQGGAFACCTPQRLYLVDVETLEVRVLAECPPEWSRFDAVPIFSSDGTRFATVYEMPDGRRGVAVGEVGDEPATLKSAHLWPEGEHVGYLISSFVEPFIISVCAGKGDKQNDPDASHEERARAWRLDPATGEVRPYLVVPVGFRATHQFFGPDGRLYFHKKTVPGWTPASLSSIDLDGGDMRDHYTSDTRQLGHGCIAFDGSWLVTDVQESDKNELIWIDAATGEGTIICWPNSTVSAGNSQTSHVHPVTDFESRYIAYQNDAEGKCGVYLVEVGR